MTTERFNVVVWYEGFWEYFVRDVDDREAVETAYRLTQTLGERGLVDRIQITDSDDFTNFLWEADKGIVYPPREEKT